MKLSIIIPIYNEENEIDKYFKQIKELLENITFELVFINNGSTDKSYKLLTNLHKANPEKIKVISLSKKFDIKGVILCGLKHSSGEYTAVYDFTKGVKPKILLEMLNYLDNNSDTDYTYLISSIKTNEFLKKYLYAPFYKNDNYIIMIKTNVKTAILNCENNFVEENRFFTKSGFTSKGFEENIIEYTNIIKINIKTIFLILLLSQILLGIFVFIITLLISLITSKFQIVGLMFALMLILNSINNFFIYFLIKKNQNISKNSYIEKHILAYDEDIL